MLVLRYKEYAIAGGEYVEFTDERGYLNGKNGKVKLTVKNAKNYIKRNPKTAAGIGLGVAASGLAAGYMAKKKKDAKEKEKKYSEEGSGVGKKLAVGAATVGTGLLAAKKGFLGVGAQKSVNKGIASIGTKIAGSGNKTISNFGNKIAQSGASGYGKAVQKQTYKNAINNGASKFSAGRQSITAERNARKEILGV